MADTDSKEIKQEICIKKTVTKDIYEFEDSEKKIKKISKEKYHKKDLEIHFPWNFDGSLKYSTLEKIEFHGFGGNLPVGVYKSASYGYGFNSLLQPVGDYLGSKFKIKVIKINKTGNCILNESTNELILNEDALRKWYDLFKSKSDQHKEEKNNLAQTQLKVLFPDKVKDVELTYIKNSINEVFSTWGNSIDEFSDKDKEAIKDLFDKLSLTEDFFTVKSLIDTKSKIDKKYIDDVIVEYKDMMSKLLTDSEVTEKKWQAFLNTHSWIFSYIFSFPIILFQDEAYVGGKNLSNKNGKVTDFLIKNDLSNNVAFLEIKTHKTEILKKGKAYRGNDVFAMSPDLSGAISQVLNQRDNFQKNYANLKLESDEDFETFNSKCVVLMGQISSLTKKQLRPFELLKSNSKDVEIITFDELLSRIENVQKLIEGKFKLTKPKKSK